MMGLLRKNDPKTEEKVDDARKKVGLALLHMDAVLKEVEEQADSAKEVFGARRAAVRAANQNRRLAR